MKTTATARNVAALERNEIVRHLRGTAFRLTVNGKFIYRVCLTTSSLESRDFEQPGAAIAWLCAS